jgi:hypothetical protein
VHASTATDFRHWEAIYLRHRGSALRSTSFLRFACELFVDAWRPRRSEVARAGGVFDEFKEWYRRFGTRQCDLPRGFCQRADSVVPNAAIPRASSPVPRRKLGFPGSAELWFRRSAELDG